MEKCKRTVLMQFRVSEEEKEQLERKMEENGVTNMSSFLRKMAMDGYSIRLDLPELRELVSLLRRYSNNINQIARRVNGTGRVYETDIAEVRAMLERIEDGARGLLMKLSKLL